MNPFCERTPKIIGTGLCLPNTRCTLLLDPNGNVLERLLVIPNPQKTLPTNSEWVVSVGSSGPFLGRPSLSTVSYREATAIESVFLTTFTRDVVYVRRRLLFFYWSFPRTPPRLFVVTGIRWTSKIFVRLEVF